MISRSRLLLHVAGLLLERYGKYSLTVLIHFSLNQIPLSWIFAVGTSQLSCPSPMSKGSVIVRTQEFPVLCLVWVSTNVVRMIGVAVLFWHLEAFFFSIGKIGKHDPGRICIISHNVFLWILILENSEIPCKATIQEHRQRKQTGLVRWKEEIRTKFWGIRQRWNNIIGVYKIRVTEPKEWLHSKCQDDSMCGNGGMDVRVTYMAIEDTCISQIFWGKFNWYLNARSSK